jgi:hypothetical protein
MILVCWLLVIIQRVIKGIGNLQDSDVQIIFKSGILCNWWRTKGYLEQHRVPEKLTDANLDRHRHSFKQPDPNENNRPFYENTPFISTTAGTVEREVANRTNTVTPAWKIALFFATNRWKVDGWLFYCQLFLLGKKATPMEYFSEELRELNIYTGFSPFQPEGEVTGKIVIPPAQIERAEFYSLSNARQAWSLGQFPQPVKSLANPNYVKPDDYNNLRELLA